MNIVNRLIKQITIFSTLAILLLSPQAVAQEMVLQGDGTPADRLRANCDSVKNTLRRLHAADGVTRVNAGGIYDDISARLMARLNSRLALNRIDSAKLIDITAQFEKSRASFGDNYREYEPLLTALIRLDCRDNPTGFYAKLLEVRDARHKLSVSVASMNDSINDYRMAVEKLKQDLNDNGGDSAARG